MSPPLRKVSFAPTKLTFPSRGNTGCCPLAGVTPASESDVSRGRNSLSQAGATPDFFGGAAFSYPWGLAGRGRWGSNLGRAAAGSDSGRAPWALDSGVYRAGGHVGKANRDIVATAFADPLPTYPLPSLARPEPCPLHAIGMWGGTGCRTPVGRVLRKWVRRIFNFSEGEGAKGGHGENTNECPYRAMGRKGVNGFRSMLPNSYGLFSASLQDQVGTCGWVAA